LACNNFEIIDIGVMVPCDKILEIAIKENVDIIGLSGLITPSLDEMVYVAKEMQRLNFKIPLLIGGATTSRIHTAVKVDPVYDGPVVHVLDASKGVPVASNLLSEDLKANYIIDVKKEYADMREAYANRKEDKNYITYAEARVNKFVADFSTYIPTTPTFLGNKYFNNYDLAEVRKYIDWTPFFQTWMLQGKYPKIFENETIGKEAKKLFDDANAMLDVAIAENWLQANGVVGLYPANSVDDDTIEIYKDDSRAEIMKTFHNLRQQGKKGSNLPNISLTDFIAPKESGVKDYLGFFAVTTGLGIESKLAEFKKDHDDYNDIMLKAIADRLAEAFAELMHEKVRKELWGYAAKETLSEEELIKETYQGIRPAPGYPACPDHTEKPPMFELLDVTAQTGIILTESNAMYPASAVSGMYYAHPDAKYFGLGKIAKDQVEAYAKRKNMDLAVLERWLSQNVNYDV